jgi:hypothetical protein
VPLPVIWRIPCAVRHCGAGVGWESRQAKDVMTGEGRLGKIGEISLAAVPRPIPSRGGRASLTVARFMLTPASSIHYCMPH